MSPRRSFAVSSPTQFSFRIVRLKSDSLALLCQFYEQPRKNTYGEFTPQNLPFRNDARSTDTTGAGLLRTSEMILSLTLVCAKVIRGA